MTDREISWRQWIWKFSTVIRSTLPDSVLSQINEVQLFGRYIFGRAIARAVSRWLPIVMWDLRWTKWRWGRFSPSTSVSPASFHSTNFFTITITYHLRLVQKVSSGRSTKISTPLTKKKGTHLRSTLILYSHINIDRPWDLFPLNNPINISYACLIACYIYRSCLPTFRENVLPLSSDQKCKPSKQDSSKRSKLLWDYIIPRSRKQYCSQSLSGEYHISLKYEICASCFKYIYIYICNSMGAKRGL
jgi:hypothetical protein